MDPLVRKRLILENAKARRQMQLQGLLQGNIEGAFLAGPEQDAIVDRARTEMSADRAGRGWDMAGQQQAVTTPFAQPLRQEAIQLAREGISDPTLGADVSFGGVPLSQVAPTPSAPPAPAPYAPPARSTDKPATQTDYADFTRDYIEKVDKRSRMFSGFSMLFGVPDRSEDYATRALANFKGHMTQRGMGQLVGKEFTSNMALFDAAYNAGIPPSAMKDLFSLGLVKKAVKDEKKYKQYNFYDPAKPDQMQSGFIIEQPGQSPARFFYGADGQPTPVPSNWVGKSGGATSVSVSTGIKPTTAVPTAMINMSQIWMREAQDYWLNEEGELRDNLTFGDALGFMGPARTTKTKMERALSVALRLESGAAIGEDERAQFYDLFMPNWMDWVSGDKEAAIVAKFKAFREYMDLLNELIGPGVGTGGSDEDKAAVAAAFRFVIADAEEKMKERKETVPDEGKVLDMGPPR
tara:strand:- start:3896 stop:5290 length:1395 start_codon:yes stop_codon:yes gene_type:complete